MNSRDEADTFNFYNEIFTRFDEATCAYGLEKIKTVCSSSRLSLRLHASTNASTD